MINNDYFILLITLSTLYNFIYIYALIDNKTSITVFINVNFIKLHYLKLCNLEH